MTRDLFCHIKVTAFRARAHAGVLNSQLTQSGIWYDQVRKTYGGK